MIKIINAIGFVWLCMVGMAFIHALVPLMYGQLPVRFEVVVGLFGLSLPGILLFSFGKKKEMTHRGRLGDQVTPDASNTGVLKPRTSANHAEYTG